MKIIEGFIQAAVGICIAIFGMFLCITLIGAIWGIPMTIGGFGYFMAGVAKMGFGAVQTASTLAKKGGE